MIKAECGCYIMQGVPYPKVELICEHHAGMALYGDYDKSVERLCDELCERFEI